MFLREKERFFKKAGVQWVRLQSDGVVKHRARNQSPKGSELCGSFIRNMFMQDTGPNVSGLWDTPWHVHFSVLLKTSNRANIFFLILSLWMFLVSESRSIMSTLCDSMDYTVHGTLQARILEWVSLSLLQGIFPTQGSNPGIPQCRQILYQLRHKGSQGNGNNTYITVLL